jgi:glycosyltransferase involved in cell wall biosynthesis
MVQIRTGAFVNQPLKVCLLLQGDDNWIGGIEYIKNITLALSCLPHDHRSTVEISLLCRKSIEEVFYDQIKPYLKKIYYEEDLPGSLMKRIYWKFTGIISGRYDARLDTFFRTNCFDFIYPFSTRRRGLLPYRSAAWIADFQHKHMPEYFTARDIRKRDITFSGIAENAPIVVLSSKTAQHDFGKYYPGHAHKSRVLSFCTYPMSLWYEEDPIEAQRRYTLPDRFFLVSNQFWQHKNHMAVFRAMKILREKAIYPVIACTGRVHDHRQGDYGDTIKQAISDMGLTGQVHLLGLIPRIDQIQLMRRSLAVIQPSLFEGWSTVVEDARCLGKPIILSDIPVHMEQNPLKGIFFQKDSPEDLAHHMGQCWDSCKTGPVTQDEKYARDRALEAAELYGHRILDLMMGRIS